ncbi:MAG TPA: hypothetical protein VF826_03555, partial [Chloroflexia bacterium]
MRARRMGYNGGAPLRTFKAILLALIGESSTQVPFCHSERSEESRPSPTLYHLSYSHTAPQENGKILVED